MTEWSERQRVNGQTFREYVESRQYEGVVAFDPDSTIEHAHFEQFRFACVDHASVVEEKDAATLILSTNSHGTLWSDYDGDKNEGEIHPGIFHFVPVGTIQRYDFKGATDNIATLIRPELISTLRDQNPEIADVSLDEPWRGFVQPRMAKLVVNQNRLVRSGEMGWRSLADANMVQIGVELMCLMANRK
ncbi:MAG: hypothetical protein AAGJ87_02635, partial [Pseudomonadota bacterium]